MVIDKPIEKQESSKTDVSDANEKGQDLDEFMKEKKEKAEQVAFEEENNLKEAERKRRKMEEKAVSKIMKEDAEQLTNKLDSNLTDQLNKLTGQPHEDDTIFYAISMCAPYCVLANYTFKAKLQPGTIARGKTIKSIRYMMETQAQRDYPEHLQFVKAIKDSEAINGLISNARVSGGSGKMRKGKNRFGQKKVKQKKPQPSQQSRKQKNGKKRK